MCQHLYERIIPCFAARTSALEGKVKVIHLISGGDTGGARTHVYSLLKYLGQIIDVQLVCFRGGDFADGAAALGIPTMVLDGGFLPNLAALKKLIRAGSTTSCTATAPWPTSWAPCSRRACTCRSSAPCTATTGSTISAGRSPAPFTARSISGPAPARLPCVRVRPHPPAAHRPRL